MPTEFSYPVISVVVPVYNESRFIENTIRTLLAQDYPKDKLEILVVDGMSEDNTREIISDIAQEYPNVRLLLNRKRRSSSGRNIGFQNGRGDYFVVVDGHCYIPDDQLIKNIALAFYKSKADCLGRPQFLDPPGLTDFQKAVADVRALKICHSGDSHIFSEFEGFISPVSNGAAYRRDVFDKIGYVDENFDAGEDLEFNYRVEKAELSCYTAPNLMVKYYPRDSIRSLFTQLYRYGVGRCRFNRKHSSSITFNQLVPLIFVVGIIGLIGMLFGVATGVLGELWVVPLGIVYGMYLMIVFYSSLKLSFRESKKALPMYPFIIFTVHFAIGWGYLTELFKPQRTV